MQEKARIVEIGAKDVTVIPVDIEACIGCANSECKDNGHVFTVVNRRKHEIKVGDIVKIKASMKNQLSQAVLAVGVPLTFAVAGFICVPLFLPEAGEGAQVGVSLAALMLGAAIAFTVTRVTESAMPEITEVL